MRKNDRGREMSKSKKELSFAEEVEQSLRKKFRKNIWCKFTKAINEYELVKPGDRIAVCISGGSCSHFFKSIVKCTLSVSRRISRSRTPHPRPSGECGAEV